MRVVSLVPSLTETLWELGVGPDVVGVTKFCEHPAQARRSAAVIGGTKDPDVDRVLALKPDLVVADEDENKPEHVEAWRDAGLVVHVTRVENVADVGREVVQIGRLVDRGTQAQGWQQRIDRTASEIREAAALTPRLRCFVPIWRKPLMTAAGSTFLSDVFAVAGADNVMADGPTKYFETDADAVRETGVEACFLPTEPYRFGPKHRHEFAEQLGLAPEAVQVVDGQAATWFGTRTVWGLGVVAEAVGRVRGRLMGNG